jgi:ABC-type transporter Mla subunit MlaD
VRGRGPVQTLAGSPTMVGAITTLIVVVAVFLAYNANQGLPFVPTYRVSVEIENASRLTNNNEVRIGGHRVGVVESIEAIRPQESGSAQSQTAATDGNVAGVGSPDEAIARLNLKLDETAKPLPQDSRFRVRYRSAFGLKYLEITRGDGPAAPEGYVFPAEQTIPQTEFDDINNTFDVETRENSRINLEGFGNAFAGRGTSLNQAIEVLEPLLSDLEPVSRTLAAPATRFRRFFPELGDAARIVAPVATEQAELFGNMAVAFEAISEDPEALRDTISEGVPTLETGIETLPRQRPFLRDFTTLSRLLRPGVQDIRVSLPSLNRAIDVGTPVLRRTPRMNKDLRRVLVELDDLVEMPTTKLTLERLEELFDQAQPLAENVVPAQTACNYWSYWFTVLTEHLTERDQVGFSQRVYGIGFPDANTYAPSPPFPPNTVLVPGAASTNIHGYSGVPANGRAGGFDMGPDDRGGEFRPYELPIAHGSAFAPHGEPGTEGFGTDNPDCQGGQTGYTLGDLRVPGQSASDPAVSGLDIPGSRGPTTSFWTREGERQYIDTRVSGRWPNP